MSSFYTQTLHFWPQTYSTHTEWDFNTCCLLAHCTVFYTFTLYNWGLCLECLSLHLCGKLSKMFCLPFNAFFPELCQHQEINFCFYQFHGFEICTFLIKERLLLSLCSFLSFVILITKNCSVFSCVKNYSKPWKRLNMQMNWEMFYKMPCGMQ